MDTSPIASTPPATIPNSPAAGEQNSARVVSPATSGPIVQRVAAPKTTDALHPVSSDHLAQAVKQVNDAFSQRGQDLYASFETDKATGIDVVKIVDKTTKETINQMPPREIIAFAQSLDAQFRAGQLIHNIA